MFNYGIKYYKDMGTSINKISVSAVFAVIVIELYPKFQNHLWCLIVDFQ